MCYAQASRTVRRSKRDTTGVGQKAIKLKVKVKAIYGKQTMSAVDKVATPVPWEGWNVRARQWRIKGNEKMLDR